MFAIHAPLLVRKPRIFQCGQCQMPLVKCLEYQLCFFNSSVIIGLSVYILAITVHLCTFWITGKVAVWLKMLVYYFGYCLRRRT